MALHLIQLNITDKTIVNQLSKQQKEIMINERPRKLLDFKTPAYLIQQQIGALAA